MTRWAHFCVAILLSGAGCGGAANSAQNPLGAGLTETQLAAQPNVTTTATPADPLPTGPRPTACEASSVALCDTFEEQRPGEVPDSNRWMLQLSDANAVIEVSAMQAAQGHQSLHVHVSGTGYQRVVIAPKAMVPLTSNGFFGRAWVMCPQGSPTDSVTLFAAGGMLAGSQIWVRNGTQDSRLALTYVGDGETVQSGLGLIAGRWTCLEWQMAGSTNEVHVWTDGAEAPTLNVAPTQGWKAPAYDRMQLGWERAAATGEARDLYVDSVAFGSARVGCAP